MEKSEHFLQSLFHFFATKAYVLQIKNEFQGRIHIEKMGLWVLKHAGYRLGQIGHAHFFNCTTVDQYLPFEGCPVVRRGDAVDGA